MARFIIRIELHDAIWPQDYNRLHSYMHQVGFQNTIPNYNQVRYQLPLAEYYIEGQYDLSTTFVRAKNAAILVGKRFSIIVSECTQSMWEGLPIVR